MTDRLLTDELWNEIEYFFPTYKLSPKRGRPPAENRILFTCIQFVIKTGVVWGDVPSVFLKYPRIGGK